MQKIKCNLRMFPQKVSNTRSSADICFYFSVLKNKYVERYIAHRCSTYITIIINNENIGKSITLRRKYTNTPLIIANVQHIILSTHRKK